MSDTMKIIVGWLGVGFGIGASFAALTAGVFSWQLAVGVAAVFLASAGMLGCAWRKEGGSE